MENNDVAERLIGGLSLGRHSARVIDNVGLSSDPRYSTYVLIHSRADKFEIHSVYNFHVAREPSIRHCDVIVVFTHTGPSGASSGFDIDQYQDACTRVDYRLLSRRATSARVERRDVRSVKKCIVPFCCFRGCLVDMGVIDLFGQGAACAG